jgi:hypothetical protein
MRHVDPADARVRVRRADEMSVGLTRKVEVVTVAAPARQQARVFAAAQRLAEALSRGTAAGVEERQRA